MNTEDIILRWYSVTAYGVATLCVSEQDAQDVSATSDLKWPQNGPHRAVQLVDADALAALEAERDALRPEIDALKCARDMIGKKWADVCAERDALRAAIASSCAEERHQLWEATLGGGCNGQ